VYAPFDANFFDSCTTNIANSSAGTGSHVRARASVVGSTGAMIGVATNLTCSRSATGIYDFSFVAALPDNAYTICADVLNSSFLRHVTTAKSTSGFTLLVEDGSGTDTDPSSLDVTVFHNR
jgi:hypothetical protein